MEVTTLISVISVISLASAQSVAPDIVTDDGQHPCYRPCTGTPMICRYTFTVEMYSSLSLACFACPVVLSDCFRPDCVSVDGTRRSVFVANRRIPGPGIHVCQGDTIVVEVVNEASPHSTSIHWHGILQKTTPFMDGVPMVTQCPIPPFSTFQYTFPVPQSGSYLWHSHSSLQKVDGLFGALIVRENKDRFKYRYDFDLLEHVISVNDWYEESIIEEFMRLEFHTIYTHPATILVNGRGRFRNLTDTAKQFLYPPADRFTLDGRGKIQVASPNETQVFQTPLSTFNVTQGKRYRFRLIGAGVQCNIQVSIDEHPLEIIATDGSPVKATVVDAVNIATGERYDFILTADKPVANYWMKFRGLEDCDNRTVSGFQVAILHYDGAPDQDPPGKPSYEYTRASGTVLNYVSTENVGTELKGAVVNLDSALPKDLTVTKFFPDSRLFISFDFVPCNDSIYNRPEYFQPNRGQPYHEAHPIIAINGIRNTFTASPLLSQWSSVNQSLLCNETSLKSQGIDCAQACCRCAHLLRVPINHVVEVLLIDLGILIPTGGIQHPFHLHGHCFRVMAMGKFPQESEAKRRKTIEELIRLSKENSLNLKFDSPVCKDTINVPTGGYVVIRFLTDNPGFWFLHCHNDLHMDVGMSLTIQTGDQRTFLKPPPGFPTCTSYKPSEKKGFY